MVNTTIENLNARNVEFKYKFQNQKMSTLAMESLKNEFFSLPLSNMNESGDYFFNCDYIRNCQFNGWFSQPETKNLCAYDYNKHYTSCLMGKDCVDWKMKQFITNKNEPINFNKNVPAFVFISMTATLI